MASAACFHCGEFLPVDARWPVTVRGESQQTCCPGCQAACRTIVELGLDNYYLHRDKFSARPDNMPVPDDLFAHFDDNALVEGGYVHDARDSAGSRECTLMVEGLRCAACGWLIEKSLHAMPGVDAASVNLTSGRIRVRWQDGKIQLRDLLLRIRKLGYRALPFRGDGIVSAFDRERRMSLLRLVVAAFGMMQVMNIAVGFYGASNIDSMDISQRDYLRVISFLITTPVVFFSGWPFLRNAWSGLRGGLAGMDLPVAVAILLAYFASLLAIMHEGPEVWFDSVTMFVFFLSVGRHLELEARRKANRVVDNLSAALPLTANRIRIATDGSPAREETIPASQLRRGDLVLVKAGETIPADGRIREGNGHIDESMLTGEPLPVRRGPGDAVTGGCLSTDAVLRIEITSSMREGRLSRIVDLVGRAQETRPQLQEIADRVARHFVIILLLLTAVTWLAWHFIDPSRAFWIALAVLVVSCPCALSLATPAAYTVATNALTRRGLLLTRGHVLSTLPKVRAVVFDKTGTLTEGRPQLLATHVFASLDEREVLHVAALLERDSEHPLARAFQRTDLQGNVSELHVLPGRGIEGLIDGRRYRLGSAAWMQSHAFSLPAGYDDVQVWLADEYQLLAAFRLGDRARPEAAGTIADLRARGLEVHLLSGDASIPVARMAKELGITHWQAGASPEAKVEYLHTLRARLGAPVLMLGDGINDAPVLSTADVSIAIGEGTDLARTAADAVLLRSRLDLLISAFNVASATRRTVHQNLGWALGYNIAMIPLAVLGFMPPWLASLGMASSSLIVVFNALAVERRSRDPLSLTLENVRS